MMDAGGVGLRACGEFADGELARAGLHVAQQAKLIMLAQHILLGEVAMEVQAVQAECLRCDDFLLRELGHREETIQSPEAPGDGRVDADAAAVDTEERIRVRTFRAEAFRCEPAEAEGDGAGVGFSASSGACGDAQVIQLRVIEIPYLSSRALYLAMDWPHRVHVCGMLAAVEVDIIPSAATGKNSSGGRVDDFKYRA
jgi:hypothetical protein